MADFYELLGVRRDAEGSAIRQAYLRLAREQHPDRFTDPTAKARAQETFKEITSAFNTLSNEQSRRAYDAELERPRPTSPEELAQLAFARGTESLEARDLAGAVELFRAAAAHAPNEARYHAALGRALAKIPASAREAVQSLETAVRLSPRSGPLHAELASVLVRQGLRVRARKYAEEALKLAPQDPVVARAAAECGLLDTGPAAGGGGLKDLFRRKP
jgi:curved DNA-binding protein CbpA